MENQTSAIHFHLSAFLVPTENEPLISVVFFIIYFIGVLGNLIIILVVCKDNHLHTPMYIFLCNLAFVDICFITSTLSKLMDILLSGSHLISFINCFIQMHFVIFFSSTEVILLSSMAYDRYVAICNPLKYQLIMNMEKCVHILEGTWLGGFGNALFLTGFASTLLFCNSYNIQQFYCDVKALTNISCSSRRFQIIIFVEALFGFFPFFISFGSYIKIISSILHIKTTNSRRKAFSTCTSHLTVLIIFYSTILSVYLKSPKENSVILDQVFSILYAAVTPMLNPLIYSLRNKDVKHSLMKILAVNSN